MEKRAFKILVVDDVPENIQTITGFLEQYHPEYRLYQATRAVNALEIVRAMKMDLVIADWDMPGMSGIELAGLLKQDASTNHIPVIIVTGIMITPEDLEVALTAGAYDYIRKPVDPVELCARAHSALSFVSLHQQEINEKNIELDQKSLHLAWNNQFLSEIIKKLQHLISIQDLPASPTFHLNRLIEEIEQKIKEDNWKQFNVAFQNVHPSFSKNLLSYYPELTPSELRHCILIKLGMNNKDIATILYQSPDSIKVARSRIRKKLRLENEQNFQSFLVQF